MSLAKLRRALGHMEDEEAQDIMPLPLVPLVTYEEHRQQRIDAQQAKQTPTDRCSGHCCRGFSGLDLAMVRERVSNENDRDYADLVTLSRMLIPIDDGSGRSTCLHYDDETGNCGIYEQRPKLCREYPYGERCEFDRCTWLAAQQPYRAMHGRLQLLLLDTCNKEFRARDFDRSAARGDFLRGVAVVGQQVVAAAERRFS